MSIQIIDKKKQLLLLKSIPFFGDFTDNNFVALLNHCTVMKYVSGRYIFREDTYADAFYVILKGSVNVLKENKNKGARKLVTLPHGECFGEMAVLLNETRTASIVAEEDTYIFEIKLEEVKKADPEVAEKLFLQFAITIAKRLDWMNNLKIEEST